MKNDKIRKHDDFQDIIDRDKIERQCKGLREMLSSGIPNDFAQGELHALSLVLNGFYLKK
jgi:hypothetical protein